MHRKCLILLGTAVLLASCQKPPVEPVTTEPIGQPLYPKPEAVVKPTPTPAMPRREGWIQVQALRWEKARIRPEKEHFVKAIAQRIERNRGRYAAVERATGVPWQIIGCIHNMECSQNFRKHLHNGDPIIAPTRHVPAKRPKPWLPPNDWETSAGDALRFDKLHQQQWNDIAVILDNVEGYNGRGHQRYHPDVPTPYLWSWSTISKPGKYIADGKWSSTAVSQQCGVVPILRALNF